MTDIDYEKLAQYLARASANAMSLEMVDGFFCALVSGPAPPRPIEFIPVVLGQRGPPPGWADHDLQACLDLLMKHWNVIASELLDGRPHTPLLVADEHGAKSGNTWAQGFLKGMDTAREDWSVLLDDEDYGGALVAIFALAHEHHPDPDMRPYKESVSPGRRAQLISGAAEGVLLCYRYFLALRRAEVRTSRDTSTYRRDQPKPRRNSSCPCGSGKKYKLCCGRVILN